MNVISAKDLLLNYQRLLYSVCCYDMENVHVVMNKLFDIVAIISCFQCAA